MQGNKGAALCLISNPLWGRIWTTAMEKKPHFSYPILARYVLFEENGKGVRV
jgi:hypothetical protein